MDGDAADEWTEGIAFDDPVLGERVVALVAGASGGRRGAEPLPRDVRTAVRLLDVAHGQLLAGLEADDRSGPDRPLAELAALQVELRQYEARVRERSRARVQAALGRLQHLTDLEQLAQVAPSELCRCGFDRVMLSRIEGAVARPQVWAIPDDPDGALELMRLTAGRRVPLDHLLPETEILRRPGALLIADARRDGRVDREMLEASGTRSYVAAPIVAQGTVIGFLHADCVLTRRTLGEFDRELVGTFARGLSALWEGAELVARLHRLRQDVRRAHASVRAVMDEFCDAPIEIDPPRRPGEPSLGSAVALLAPEDVRIEAVLTRRELDVMRLMATGRTNTAIAEALVVSPATVKSHVKHILRKLRAKNRAEAVSRYVAQARR